MPIWDRFNARRAVIVKELMWLILFRTYGDQGNCASEEVRSMSQPRKRKYPAEFKERAVKLAVEAGQSIAQTARDLGVNANT
jgi:hypothetical protein